MTLADLDLQYRIYYPENIKSYGSYMQQINDDSGFIVSASESLKDRIRELLPPGSTDRYLEYVTLVSRTGQVLAEHDRFLFHAAAFLWRGNAWLLTGPSGAGKTTQYLNWKGLWPEEVKIICGDMPVLSTKDEQGGRRIWVYPSPWNGKEGYGFNNQESVPLGGIVYLHKSDTDQIEPILNSRYAKRIWHMFVGQADTIEQIENRARFMDLLLREYPIWILRNRGDTESAKLTRDVFERYLEKGNTE